MNFLSSLRRFSWIVAVILVWIFLSGSLLWAGVAIYFDLPFAAWRLPSSILFAVIAILAVILIPGCTRKALSWLALFVLVLGWWLTLSPSDNRDWQKDVDRTAWADIEGDRVTIHNVRNFDYRAEFDYTPNWETRTYNLNDIRGVDLFVTFWGSPWIAHPIVSFQFGDSDHVVFSVETRKIVGQDYSAVRGFFRQYELIYIVGDERDLIRLRTNYRKDEEVYLYHTTASAEAARIIFLDYLITVNSLHDQPRFYNAITSNCTTNIRIHTKAAVGDKAAPWDWRLLLNGKGDEYAYQYGRLAGNLPFDELKRQAHINDVARQWDQSPDFSMHIRENRVGFGPN